MSKRIIAAVVIATIAMLAWWRSGKDDRPREQANADPAAESTPAASPGSNQRAELIASKFESLVRGGSHWNEDAQRETSGRVYDQVTGEAVAGVEVVFRAKGAAGEASAVSNEDGIYSLTLGPGGYKVFAHGDGVYGLGMRTLLVPFSSQAPVRYDVPVQRTADVAGVVLSSDGDPVEGARVQFSSQLGRTVVDSRELYEVLPHELEAVTGSDGKFELAVVPGKVTLIAKTEAGYGEREISLVGGRRYEVEIRLDDLAEVVGRVVSPQGSVVAGANISVVVYREKERIVTKSLVSDKEGEFSALVRAGEGVVEARADGFGQTKPQWVTLSPGKATKPLKLALHDEAFISGVVHDSQGTPIAEAKVTVSATNSRIRVSEKTGTDGRFRLGGLGPGDWQMAVWAQGYAQGRRADLQAPTTDLDITMVRAKGIRGAVVDESGQPVKEFTVRVDRYTSSIDGRTMPGEGSGTRYTSATGSFELAAVEPGDYSIVVSSPGRAAVEVSGIDVPVDGYGETTVTMAGGGVVAGVVVSAGDGRPVANASVTPKSGYEGRPVVTDDGGSFRLEAVGAGPRSLAVSHPEFGTTVRSVNVAAGSEANVRIELASTGDDKKLRMSGIGAVIDVQHGALVITTVVAAGPAARAGLRIKDIITAIDGAPVQGLTLEEAADRLRGRPGTVVRIDLERSDKPMEQSVERGEFVAASPGRGTVS